MIDQRIYLFGASNLWFSRHAALTEVRKRFPGRLEIGLACGPGRAYGVTAGNPVARYHPLKDIAFGAPSSAPTLAVLTDIGNDIAYGQLPAQVVEWVDALATRLERQGIEVVVTGVPAESLRQLPSWMFLILRKLYFTGSPISQSAVNQRLDDLQEGLIEMCQRRGLQFLDIDSSWYGLDRFHLRPVAMEGCWRQWLSRLSPEETRVEPLSWARTVHLRPADYWLFGKPKGGRGFYPDFLEQADLIVR